ncbi:3-hydroxyisobutyrate dehydrogenase [Stella humosa]|uniref:3-hydroxyisobutyrate dehydrogenase n=1 Tax=Stella humosa TaxID=94 RepID=A0A3N1LJZ2_9PROT|nr:NAD-binding protein [Stella humosa]ROP91324.1 3-hydroxyisobutyrate dehydrogenase [Stella humosa]BBK34320.1 3-hydroxyisobutyrate dehydrogenase [Stella humosa]
MATGIGFIGLGAMGAGMAANLARTNQVEGGSNVTGYDVVPAAIEQFVAAGGRGAASVAEAADGAGLLILMVATDAQADAVLFGEGGALAVLPAGSTIVLHATVPPAYAEGLGRRLAAAGFGFVDAPVTGGKGGAESGTLTIMASGSDAAFAAAEPSMARYSARMFRVGTEPGKGSTMKMAHQLLAGVHIAAAAEALALATRAGVDPAQFFDVVTGGAARSWMFENRGARMVKGDFTPTSAVEIFVKDLGIVLDGGRNLRFPLPIAAAAHQQFLAAAAAGHGRIDDSAVVKVYEMLAGISVAGAAGKGSRK